MIAVRRIAALAASAVVSALCAGPLYAAGDPAIGRALYINPNGAPLGCAAAACHGPNPTVNQNGITRAADQPMLILNAINVRPDMMFLKNFVSATDAEHLAAYIANPNGTSNGSLTPAPATLAFGDQAQGSTSAARTVTVTNGSTVSVTLNTVAIGGVAAGDFTLAGTCANGMALAPNASCTVTATFRPSALGARAASFSLIHTGGNSPNVVAMSGNGVSAPGPSANLSATSLAFGNQALTTTSAARDLMLSNTGPVALTINSLTITGTNASDFARSTAAGDCAVGMQLGTSQSCKISTTFAPAALGARIGSLDIATNAPGSPHKVALTGTGETAPTPLAALSTNSLFFGNYNVGTTSPTLQVTLRNAGSMPLQIAAMNRTGADFAHTTNCGATLAPNATCTIDVTFTPTATAAMLSGSIAIQTNAPNPQPTITLAGTGVAAGIVLPTVTLNPATLTFSTAQALTTTSAAQTITVTNSGTVALTISNVTLAGASSSEFARTGTCVGAAPVTVAPNGTCTLSVTFTPATVGTRTANLTLVSNAQGNPSAALSGVGVAPAAPAVTLSTTSVTFGNQAVGSTSGVQVVVLNNTGNAPLPIQSITPSAEFVATNTCGTSVAAGGMCTIGVSFAPSATGARTGTLTITDGASGSPRTVALSGTGVPAQSASPSGTGTAATGDGGGGGGCTMGGSGDPDPILALLALAAFLLIRRRERNDKHDKGPHLH